MAQKLSEAARRAAVRVDEDRLWGRLMAMAEIGAREDGGVAREALTAPDRKARSLLAGWGKELGLTVSIDDAANLFLRREGSDRLAPVLSGSHLDSQPAGGKFDGAFGVLAALEAVQAIDEAGISTKHPLEIVSWTNEEGSRYAPACTGSMCWAGVCTLQEVLNATDREGMRFGDALAATLMALPDLPRRRLGGECAAYLEPHIEQGPLLEAAGVPIGIVTGVQGSRWFTVTIEGKAAHAGTTPMRRRRDALQGAVRVIEALNRALHDPDDVLRFTVGRMALEPNTPNAVPARAMFTIDLRHPDADILARHAKTIAGIVQSSAAPLAGRVQETMQMAPVAFDAKVIDVLQQAVKDLGIDAMNLASGAFHDAVHIARKGPAGMLFVPCRDGLSHHPDEHATPSALAAGARVLAAALVELAEGH